MPEHTIVLVVEKHQPILRERGSARKGESARSRCSVWRGCPPPGACRPKRLPSASGGGPRRPPASARDTPPARRPWLPSQSPPWSDTWGCTYCEARSMMALWSKTKGIRSKSSLAFTLSVWNQCFSPAGWRGSGWGPGLHRSDWSESRCTGPDGVARKEGSRLVGLGKDRGGALLRSTLILRGPSRRPRFLLGVSMLIILSRPLSREPNTFPVLFFLPLSLVAAISRDRDLRSKSNQTLNLQQQQIQPFILN